MSKRADARGALPSQGEYKNFSYVSHSDFLKKSKKKQFREMEVALPRDVTIKTEPVKTEYDEEAGTSSGFFDR